MTELHLTDENRELQGWLADQDLDEKERVLWNFHRWMRQETDLESGSVVDYRKYVAEMLTESGELVESPNDLGSHKRAAVNRFQEFRDSVKNIY